MKRILTYTLYLFVVLCVPGVSAYAQNAEKVLIRGKIIDAKDKLPIIGATVIEQDKDKRTVAGGSTDINGNFAFRVTDVNNKLVVQFMGYATQTLTIGPKREFAVSMTSTTKDLDVVAITTTRKAAASTGLNIDVRDQTTSTATLNTKDIEELQATTIDQAMQGRLPGIDVVSNSGDPGAGMSIRIRGTSSINGVTNPLIIVDGLPFETQVPTNFNFSTADQNQYADLLSIAPSDIKDISVMKDVAATALWGSRAANGVLVINTKRGTIGPPTISYTFKGTTSLQPSHIPMLTGDQYSSFIPEMVMNVNGAPLNTTSVKELAYNPLDLYYYNNYSQNTDWVDAISRTGYELDNNLSISGGGEKARYFASLGYNNSKGTVINTDLNRINSRLNLDYHVSEKINISTMISYVHTNKNAPADDIGGQAYTRMPNASIFEYNDFGVLTPNYFSPSANVQGQYPSVYNPVALGSSALNQTITDRITPRFNLQYQLAKAFKISSDVQFDINNGKQNAFLPQIASGRPFTESTVNQSSSSDYDNYSIATKTDFSFSPALNEKHYLLALLSLQTNDTKSLSHSQAISNAASSSLTDPAAQGTIQSIAASIGQSRQAAAVLTAQYKLLDRYIVNFVLRGDGNSQFGENSRYGLFPSISGRYRISGEKFMEKYSGWLDDLSFRGGYGVVGNSPGRNYLFYGNYAGTSANYLGLSGVTPSSIQLNNLRWERVVGIDAGVKLVMFKNRLDLDFGVYRNRTYDLYTPGLAIPSVNGFTSVAMNVGTMENRGVEFSLFSTPYRSKNWLVNFNFNISNNINKVLEISPYYPRQSGNVNQNGNYLSLLQENNPLGSFYGYRYKGVYKDAAATVAKDANGNPIITPDGVPVQMQFNYPTSGYVFQPGDAMYEDINHDGNINFQDVVYLGNGNPLFQGGFGPTMSYKGVSLNLFFNYRVGGKIINNTRMQTTNQYDWDNQSTAVLQRWRQSGDDTNVPRALYRAGYNWLGSDRYVESGTFLRFSQFTLKYDVPKNIAARLGAKRLSTYFTGQNLLTFTRYTGQDPEVSVRGSGIFVIAQDNSRTPALRRFTFGLTTSF